MYVTSNLCMYVCMDMYVARGTGGTGARGTPSKVQNTKQSTTGSVPG